MSDRESILASLRRAFPDLKRQYPIQALGLFGSFARGDADDDEGQDHERDQEPAARRLLDGELGEDEYGWHRA